MSESRVRRGDVVTWLILAAQIGVVIWQGGKIAKQVEVNTAAVGVMTGEQVRHEVRLTVLEDRLHITNNGRQ